MAIPLRAVAQMSSKRCKKSLFVIPYCFTFANALFGFLSVIEALQGNTITAACCIGLAACADALDGRLARAFGSTSYLGAELDSLCDAISFCCAPTILIYSLVQESIGIFGILMLGFYLCAGLFRLAKFNILHNNCNVYFSGLSTPVSAFFLSTLVLYFDWFERSFFWFLVDPFGIILVVSFLSLLMISAIPFPSFKKSFYAPVCYYLFGIGTSIYLALYKLYGVPALFLLLSVYIIYSIIMALGIKIFNTLLDNIDFFDY